MKTKWKARLRNPYFWIGLIGVILTAAGADQSGITSWGVLAEEIFRILKNPFLFGTVSLAVLGVFSDMGGEKSQDDTKKEE